MDPATPDPKISDEALAACAEKIKPYLEVALAHGIAPRPITGLMLRLGESLGVDIGAVGQVSDTEGDPNEYYDDIMKAVESALLRRHYNAEAGRCRVAHQCGCDFSRRAMH